MEVCETDGESMDNHEHSSLVEEAVASGCTVGPGCAAALGRIGSAFVRDEAGGTLVGYFRAVLATDCDAAFEAFEAVFDVDAPILESSCLVLFSFWRNK
jgi:hypothetical protein